MHKEKHRLSKNMQRLICKNIIISSIGFKDSSRSLSLNSSPRLSPFCLQRDGAAGPVDFAARAGARSAFARAVLLRLRLGPRYSFEFGGVKSFQIQSLMPREKRADTL